MQKLYTTIFSILTFLFAGHIHAQGSYDLTDCLVYAFNNSPKLRSERLAQEKEATTMMEQKSDFLPQVDAFVQYHNYFNDLPTYIFPQSEGSILAGESLTGPYPIQLGLPHNLNTGLEINQTIFDMNFFGNGALQQHYQAYQDIRLSIAEEEVLYQVATLFYQVALNEERLDFLNMNLDRLQKLQDIVKLQADQGFARQSDYNKLLVKTSNLQSNKNKLQSGIKQQTRYLKLLMGMDQEESLILEFGQGRLSETDLHSGEKTELLEQQLLKEQHELHLLNTRKLNAEYYPRLQAYAALLFQAQRQQFNFFASNQDWYSIHQWGLKLSIPIMRGFERKTKKQLSEIVDEQLSFGLEKKQIQGEVDYQNAISELEVARIEQEAQRENVVLAEQVYEQSELSYEQGSTLLMDFLDSEATLREAKMLYATAILDTRLAELKILKASGKLKELINQ
jgi:outer membrane protein